MKTQAKRTALATYRGSGSMNRPIPQRGRPGGSHRQLFLARYGLCGGGVGPTVTAGDITARAGEKVKVRENGGRLPDTPNG